jgi:hypothetical protein
MWLISKQTLAALNIDPAPFDELAEHRDDKYAIRDDHPQIEYLRGLIYNRPKLDKVDKRSIRPGDIIHWMTQKAGFEMGRNCGCTEMRKQMNDWGWIGCLRNRRTLVDWFVSKADQAGVKLTSRDTAGLLRAAVKALWSRE